MNIRSAYIHPLFTIIHTLMHTGKLQIPGTHGSDKNVIISTTTIAFVLLIIIASTTTVIVLLCKWKSNHIADGFQFTKLYQTNFGIKMFINYLHK